MPERRKSRILTKGNLGSIVFLVALGCFTLLPVLVILAMSFDISGIGVPYAFGTSGWLQVFSDPQTLKALLTSFLLTIRVPLGLLIALIIAWLLVRVRVPGGRFFEYLFWFAYFLPALPMLTGWILLLDANFGYLNSLIIWSGLSDHAIFNIHSAGGIIWTHLTTQTVPILVILLAPALRMIDRSLDDAAIVAGAGSWRVFSKIVMPLAVPALFVAGSAVAIKSLESFETEQILGVPADIYVYANKIYDFVTDDTPRMPEAMGLSSVFLIIMITLGGLYQLYQRRRGKPETFSGQTTRVNTAYSSTLKKGGAALLAIYVFVTIILPFLVLISGSFMQLFGFLALDNPWTTRNWTRVLSSNEFQSSAVATIVLGVSSALPGTFLFAGIAWAMTNMRHWAKDIAALLVWLPWAFPGIILGVGLLELTLVAPGFSALHGTIYPLIVAILIKELPIGIHMMHNSVRQTNRDLIISAQVAGAGKATVFRRIILPLNTPALIVVFLLIFSVAVRDVGTLVLLAPPGVQTLSLITFKYAIQSEFEAAAVVGTIVALISLATSVLAYRIASRVGLFR